MMTGSLSWLEPGLATAEAKVAAAAVRLLERLSAIGLCLTQRALSQAQAWATAPVTGTHPGPGSWLLAPGCGMGNGDGNCQPDPAPGKDPAGRQQVK